MSCVIHRSSKLAAAEASDETQLTDDACCCDSAFIDSASLETELSPPPRRDAEPRFVAHVTEYRANPVVSRRGYLYVTDGKETEYRANPVVSRRGYLYVTDGNEADESVLVKRWVVSHSISLQLVAYVGR